MTTFDLALPLRRVLGVPGRVIPEKTCRNSGSSVEKRPSFQVLLRWVLILSVSLLMISGCGRYKEELEGAKQQIEKLTSEIKRSTDEAARSNQEKGRLTDELKVLSEKNTLMQRQLDHLNKAQAALSSENKEMIKKYGAAQEEITLLIRNKKQLTQELDELKKRVAESAPQPKVPEAAPIPGGPLTKKLQEEESPCAAVLAFMKASERIVRNQKGVERSRSLEQVRQQYMLMMKGAPEKAIKAAEEWVKEGTTFWEKPSEDSTFNLLRLRNTVLDSCGRSPNEAGFK